LEKLKEYGDETTAWYQLLLPVISRFVRAFDDPQGEENLHFWQQVCPLLSIIISRYLHLYRHQVAHYEGGGSGSSSMAGWINAFCVFNEKGKWIGHPVGQVCRIFMASPCKLNYFLDS
jgi:hypothetical protein